MVTTSTKPIPLVVLAEQIPGELTTRPQWVNWRYEPKKDKPAEWTKPPYISTATPPAKASSTDPRTWSPFDQALAALSRFDGVGFVLSETDDIAALDLDHCRDSELGTLEEWAQGIVQVFPSYWEVSPSGTGLRCIFQGRLPDSGKKKGSIEVYDRGRYVTMTGHHLPGTPRSIELQQGALDALLARIFAPADHPPSHEDNGHSPPGTALDDEALLRRARSAANGAKFTALWSGDLNGYPSPSEADLALCMMLAFWTGRDAARMDALFRQSALFRTKWDERHGGGTYGKRTILTAIERCTEVYEGRSGARASPDQTSARTSESDPLPLGIGGGAFLRRTYPPPVPIIKDLLSDEGGGWRGGEEKLGKSYEIDDEALCLVFARPVLGRFPVPTPRRVLLVSEEDSPRRTWRRLRALLRGHDLDPDDPAVQATLDDRLRVSAWEGFRFDDAAMVARLEATLTTFHPDVVYLDVLRKLTRKDLNKADQASVIVDLLDDLRRRYGCVFIVVHHYRKTQGFRAGRGSQEIGGSYVLGAWGENSLFFEPIGRKQGAVKIEVQTKDGPPVPAFRLVIEAEGPAHDPVSVRLRAEDFIETTVGAQNRDLVLQALRTLDPVPADQGKPGVPVAALVTTVKLSDKSVRGHLRDLAKEGLAQLTGFVLAPRASGRGATKVPLWTAITTVPEISA